VRAVERHLREADDRREAGDRREQGAQAGELEVHRIRSEVWTFALPFARVLGCARSVQEVPVIGNEYPKPDESRRQAGTFAVSARSHANLPALPGH
jgi:hypothetical protein